MSAVWVAEAEQLMKRVQSEQFGPRTLDSISWSLNLQSSEDTQGRMSKPTTVMELELKDVDAGPDGKQAVEHVSIEASHDELHASKLTKIDGISPHLTVLHGSCGRLLCRTISLTLSVACVMLVRSASVREHGEDSGAARPNFVIKRRRRDIKHGCVYAFARAPRKCGKSKRSETATAIAIASKLDRHGIAMVRL